MQPPATAAKRERESKQALSDQQKRRAENDQTTNERATRTDDTKGAEARETDRRPFLHSMNTESSQSIALARLIVESRREDGEGGS